MNDYMIVILLTFMWACSVLGAYAVGWIKGFDESEHQHRWNRWLLRREENRRTKI